MKMPNKETILRHKHPILLMVFSAIVYFRWLSFDIFTFSDWGYRTAARLSEFLLFPVWLSDVELGQTDLTFWRTPVNLLYGIFGSIGYASNVAEKFIVFWPLIILPCIGSYYLIKKYADNNWAALAGALAFSFNTYFIAINTQGHLLISAAGAIGVLAVIVHANNMERFSFGRTFLLSIVLLLTGSYDLRVLYILFGLLALMTAYSAIIGKIRFADSVKVFLAPCLLYGMLSAFWVFPAIVSGDFTNNAILSRNLFGNNFWNLQSSLALHHPFWNGSAPAWFTVQQPAAYFYLIPFLAILGLYVNRKNSKLLFFGLLAVLGILLGKQIDKPFSFLYPWLFGNIPGFGAFREASKFYLLTAIGYSVLIASLVAWLLRRRNGAVAWPKYAAVGVAVAVFAVSLANAKPVVTGEIGTLFVPRQIPRDYELFNEFLVKQDGYFRTFWVPRDSRWAAFSDVHPKISGAEISQTTWKELTASSTSGKSVPIQDEIVSVFTKPDGQEMLASAAVRYVVVPTQDEANGNNFFVHYGNSRQFYINAMDAVPWLEKLDIGTEELVVYENKQYKPAITATGNLAGLNSFTEQPGATAFLRTVTDASQNFTTEGENPYVAKVDNLFTTVRAVTGPSGTGMADDRSVGGAGTKQLYKNLAPHSLEYAATQDSVEFFAASVPDISVNDDVQDFGPAQKQPLLQSELQPGKRYFVQLDGTLLLLQRDAARQLGKNNDYRSLQLLTEGDNLISNAAFEESLWQPAPSDCNNYDLKPVIGMARVLRGDTEKRYSLQLEATRHSACTSTNISFVNLEESILSFDYQGTEDAYAGFYLQFNDADKTTVSEKLVISGPDIWQTYAKNIRVPKGATGANLVVYSYESDGLTRNIVRYDNFSLSRPVVAGAAQLEKVANQFEAAEVPLKPDGNLIFVRSDDDARNLIENPSFEDGLWSPVVGDCSNYDTNPQIDMKVGTSYVSSGSQSLQLEATRHTACTSKNILIDGFGDHVLSFSLLGLRAKHGGYYLKFNDDNKTVITEKIELEGSGKWQDFSKNLHVPLGATSASLTVYAYETNGRTKNTVFYDNFQLIDVPDVKDSYFVVGEPEKNLEAPEQISYRSVSPTKKVAAVQSAKQPFVLNFAESFHPGWKLYVQPNGKNVDCGVARTYGPDGSKQESAVLECGGTRSLGLGSGLRYLTQKPAFDDGHMELNGFSNGWVVDPEYVTSQLGPEYYKQNADGSISFTLVAYFKPQSYFYAGLIVSGLVFAACTAYAIWGAKSKNSRQKQYTIPEYKH